MYEEKARGSTYFGPLVPPVGGEKAHAYGSLTPPFPRLDISHHLTQSPLNVWNGHRVGLGVVHVYRITPIMQHQQQLARVGGGGGRDARERVGTELRYPADVEYLGCVFTKPYACIPRREAKCQPEGSSLRTRRLEVGTFASGQASTQLKRNANAGLKERTYPFVP
jgi:hypothetical protein